MSAQSTPSVTLLHVNDAATDRSPRLLLVSSSALEREGLSLVLQRGGFDVHAVAPENDAIQSASSPDLIIVDVPGVPGSFEGQRILDLRQAFPDTHIVLLSDRLNPDWLLTCRSANLAGYLSKSTPGPAIYRQLHLILGGERILPMKILHEIALATDEVAQSPAPSRAQALTKRDIDVLRLLVAGYSNKVIADRLKIAESTVKVVMKAMFAKIRVTNRTQAALWALNNGLESRPPPAAREPTYS